MTELVRPADLQGDKVALATRLLRLQGALPALGTTFAVSSTGQLLASSSPFSANDTSVADADWFRRATADNAAPVALQRTESWLRSGPSVVLTKIVRDPGGKPAGLVGAVFRVEDFSRLIGHTWLAPGVARSAGRQRRAHGADARGHPAAPATIRGVRAGNGHGADGGGQPAPRHPRATLAALGHDIRTPMNSIMGICSLLLDGELEHEQRVWLERIRTSCEVLLAMLNGLLEIASGEVAGADLQADEVDVIGLVQEVADTLLPQARDKGLELKTRHEDPLRGHWRVDPTRLRQVLFNLVGNAIKFTASGHVEIRASAAADPAGRLTIKLAVSDTGLGIAPEDRTSIFERFKRGTGHAKGGHAGLGLGLALCRENAVLMDGALTVESAPGVGSEFTFEFPAERVLQPVRDQRFAGRTALLIGDEDATARTIANQLGDAGVVVDMAPDGYIGLALAERIEAQRGALDLVIVQARLTGMAAEVFVLRLRDTAFGRLCGRDLAG